MSEDSEGASVEMAESASVGQAGEPQGLTEQGAPQAESPEGAEGVPTPEELDARNEAFTGPRKPMGPVESGSSPEAVPDEG